MRHPLPLLTAEVSPLNLSKGHTLLLLQDLHDPFADPELGWMAQTSGSKVVTREFDEYFDTIRLIAPNISLVLSTMRRLGVPVAYSCLGYRGADEPSAWQRAIGWIWDLDGPHGAFPSGWRPQGSEPVFAKPGWGALANESLVTFLEQREIRNVVILGALFDFGIRHTCYELADRGIGSLVISDGVAALTRAGHAATAGNIAHGMTKLRSTAELLDLLQTMRSDGAVLI